MKPEPEFLSSVKYDFAKAFFFLAMAAVVGGVISLILLSIDFWLFYLALVFLIPAGISLGVIAGVLFICFLVSQIRDLGEDSPQQEPLIAWWRQHRQRAALMDTVLLGAESCRVSGATRDEREYELARLLAKRWIEQPCQFPKTAPLQCYWQGSEPAWQVFVEQMALSAPRISLPESPEQWDGITSLDLIIDQLQECADDVWILCAGCHSQNPDSGSPLTAGEAAVLWVVGTRGGVGVTRGEWYGAGNEDLADVGTRLLQQSKLRHPLASCMSFSQPQVPELSQLPWAFSQPAQDDNFGELGPLQAMVCLTLAAWHAQENGMPCGWLATDPKHTLALGIIHPEKALSQ